MNLLARSLIVLVLAGGIASCRRSGAECAQCGREECDNLAFSVRLAGGKEVQTCCPRCGLHFVEGQAAEVKGMVVRDFDSKARFDAHEAFYVEGSDVTPCASMHGAPPLDERGCCLKPVYDRCLPSILAFQSRARAESFAREHGGVVKSLADLQAPKKVAGLHGF